MIVDIEIFLKLIEKNYFFKVAENLRFSKTI
jgi:hypothetical protein